MQSVIQKYCCHAISKTVNFPHHATKDEIRKCFIQAWKVGCKGLTVFRYNSLKQQVRTIGGSRDGELRLLKVNSCQSLHFAHKVLLHPAQLALERRALWARALQGRCHLARVPCPIVSSKTAFPPMNHALSTLAHTATSCADSRRMPIRGHEIELHAYVRPLF
jgi:ribonucleotide reductase alpha subunit